MRQLGAFILLMCVATPLFAAEPPTEESPSIPWYRWLFLGERSRPMPPKPVVKAAPQVPRADLMRMLASEKDVYIKRLESITRIKQIALDRGDEAMLKKAEDLERQAEETFAQRTAKLQEQGLTEDDRGSLERRTDDRPATAERPTRRPTRGNEQ